MNEPTDRVTSHEELVIKFLKGLESQGIDFEIAKLAHNLSEKIYESTKASILNHIKVPETEELKSSLTALSMTSIVIALQIMKEVKK